jgi:hypothetical protein
VPTTSGWWLLFVAGIGISLSASWLLVSRLERLAERAGFSEAWLAATAAALLTWPLRHGRTGCGCSASAYACSPPPATRRPDRT